MKAQFDQIRVLHANDTKLKVRKMWQLASKKALRKTEDERRPSWAQRFKNIEPLNAVRLRYCREGFTLGKYMNEHKSL